MNQELLQGLCKQLGGTLLECWGRLNGDPVAVAAGRRASLAGRNQAQRAISKQAADRQIEDFRSRNRNWLDTSNR